MGLFSISLSVNFDLPRRRVTSSRPNPSELPNCDAISSSNCLSYEVDYSSSDSSPASDYFTDVKANQFYVGKKGAKSLSVKTCSKTNNSRVEKVKRNRRTFSLYNVDRRTGNVDPCRFVPAQPADGCRHSRQIGKSSIDLIRFFFFFFKENNCVVTFLTKSIHLILMKRTNQIGPNFAL